MKKTVFLFLTLSLNAHGQPPKTLTSSEKVYGLSKFWQEVNYNFVFLDKIGKERWDSAYRAFIPIVMETGDDFQYFRELQRFCALLKDGHTNVYLPRKKEYERMTTMFGDYRLFLQNIDGKAIVVRTNASKKNEIPVGSEIIEVNGIPTRNYIDQFVSPYISSSTDYVLQDWSVGGLLSGFAGESYSVKIRRPKGDVFTLQLTHAQTTEKEVFPPFDQNNDLLEFRWVDKNIAYVSLNSFDDPKIDSLFITKLPELNKAKALIIDLRKNGGGSTNIGFEIFKYLTTDRVVSGSKSVTRNHLPTYKAWGSGFTAKDTVAGKPEWGMTKEEVTKCYLAANDRYCYTFEFSPDTIRSVGKPVVVPTALLIGHNTASAAEDFLIYADQQKHMKKIGQNTFGSTGQPYRFELVGGATARVCTKKDTYADGREFVGYGIKPDIEVKQTVADYLSNSDPVMKKAVDYLKTQIK